MRKYALLFVILAAATGFAQAPAPPDAQSDFPTVDKAANPCADFFQYSCGTWLRNTEIPADQAAWGTFSALHERNLDLLRGILDKASADDPGRNAVDQKIGDYYSSCMDETTVNAKGIEPIHPELDRIAAVHNKTELIDAMARASLHGAGAVFGFYSAADLHNADMVIANIDQGGLSLPDRDYYIKTDPKTAAIRDRYVEYITQAFTLAGQSSAQAAQSAQTVLRIETALAKAAMDRTLRRDPKVRDHKMSRQQAVALAPNLLLDRYFTAAEAPSFSQMNVGNPDFFQQINGLLESESLDAWKTYLSWHVLEQAAPWLSQPFVDADFKMQQALTGQAQIQARWKRCVNSTDRALGEALGQRYVDQNFPPDSKQRMLKMVDALEKALAEDIRTLPWMSEETKKQAEVKLAAITNKIGYPDKWRDYSSLKIVRGDLLGNFERANLFETRRNLAKIGLPPDRQEWHMTPPTVNAYYNPPQNEIVFPAGILQPPFFDKNADDAVNFGGIGLVIGYELTHGFDDQGRKYDAHGNLNDWWTAEDGKKFEERVSCVADEYTGFIAVDDLHLNGRLTLGENTADNGGARVALMALQHMIADDPQGREAQTIDGYTPAQRFFLGFGQVWCEKQRPELTRMRVATDGHSPAKYRVDGVVQNMPEFENAWSCKSGQAMVSASACRVW
jgi:putative endopeptidase